MDTLPENTPDQPRMVLQLRRKDLLFVGSAAVALLALGVAILCLPVHLALRPRPWCDVFSYVVLISLGLLPIWGGIRLLRQVLRKRGMRVLVYSDSLVYVDPPEVITCHWNEIEALWEKVSNHYTVEAVGHFTIPGQGFSNKNFSHTTYQYMIRLGDGRNLVFNDQFPNVQELGEIIRKATGPRLLSVALDHVSAGKAAEFGPLAVSERGLSENGEILEWDGVQSVQVGDDARIWIYRNGDWFRWSSVATSQIPNLVVFLTLVNTIIAGRSQVDEGEQAQ